MYKHGKLWEDFKKVCSFEQSVVHLASGLELSVDAMKKHWPPH